MKTTIFATAAILAISFAPSQAFPLIKASDHVVISDTEIVKVGAAARKARFAKRQAKRQARFDKKQARRAARFDNRQAKRAERRAARKAKRK